MSILSKLPSIVERGKKRRGRGLGSRAGAKSGRGTKRHQKAKTKIPLHFEGGQNRLVKKYPLLRGKGKNKSVVIKPYIIHTDELNELPQNTTITIESLIKHKIVRSLKSNQSVKILKRGEVVKKLIVEVPVTNGARTLIEKAGGNIK